MYEFMEQEPTSERLVRYDHVRERNRGDLAEIWQVRESHFRQHRIERGICDSVSVEPDDSNTVEETRWKKSLHCRLLLRSQRGTPPYIFTALGKYVLGYES